MGLGIEEEPHSSGFDGHLVTHGAQRHNIGARGEAQNGLNVTQANEFRPKSLVRFLPAVSLIEEDLAEAVVTGGITRTARSRKWVGATPRG
jgi:hypothetical protein